MTATDISPTAGRYKDQLTVAAKKYRLDEETEKHVENSALIYFVVALALVMSPLTTSQKMKSFDRSGTALWYNYTAVCFSFGIFFGYLSFSTAKSSEKKALSRILLLVNIMAFSTYIFTIWRIIPIWRGFHGNPVEIARFMEWFCTCPSLILIVGEVTKQNQLAKQTVSFDYVLNVMGLLAFITKDPFSYYFAFGAVASFACILFRFNQMFTSALDPKSACKLDPITVQAARIATLCSWSFCKLLSAIELFIQILTASS